MKVIEQYAFRETQMQDDLQDAQEQLANTKAMLDEV
jgi:hypothetical protein